MMLPFIQQYDNSKRSVPKFSILLLDVGWEQNKLFWETVYIMMLRINLSNSEGLLVRWETQYGLATQL